MKQQCWGAVVRRGAGPGTWPTQGEVGVPARSARCGERPEQAPRVPRAEVQTVRVADRARTPVLTHRGFLPGAL